MFGKLYEQALSGERCWIRHDDGSTDRLPVHTWLGGRQASRAESHFDDAVLDLCHGPTIDLGCGPGRLVSNLVQRGVPALGVDVSPTAIGLARDNGAPALKRDLFGPLPGMGRWHNVLLADGNVGLGGDPWRVLRRSAELLRQGGQCLAEFDPGTQGVKVDWIRLETRTTVGPWFRWAWVGADVAAELASDVGLVLDGIYTIGDRVVAALAA